MSGKKYAAHLAKKELCKSLETIWKTYLGATDEDVLCYTGNLNDENDALHKMLKTAKRLVAHKVTEANTHFAAYKERLGMSRFNNDYLQTAHNFHDTLKKLLRSVLTSPAKNTKHSDTKEIYKK